MLSSFWSFIWNTYFICNANDLLDKYLAKRVYVFAVFFMVSMLSLNSNLICSGHVLCVCLNPLSGLFYTAFLFWPERHLSLILEGDWGHGSRFRRVCHPSVPAKKNPLIPKGICECDMNISSLFEHGKKQTNPKLIGLWDMCPHLSPTQMWCRFNAVFAFGSK